MESSQQDQFSDNTTNNVITQNDTQVKELTPQEKKAKAELEKQKGAQMTAEEKKAHREKLKKEKADRKKPKAKPEPSQDDQNVQGEGSSKKKEKVNKQKNAPAGQEKSKEAKREYAKQQAELRAKQQNQNQAKPSSQGQSKDNKQEQKHVQIAQTPQTNVSQTGPDQIEDQNGPIKRQTSTLSDESHFRALKFKRNAVYQFLEKHGKKMHPKIVEFVIKIQNNQLKTSNQTCIAMFQALRQFFIDYNNTNPDKVWQRDIQEQVTEIVVAIEEFKVQHVGLKNALSSLQKKIGRSISVHDVTVEDFKEKIVRSIDEYIEEKIIYSQEAMCNYGIQLFPKDREETIMTTGYNNLCIEELFLKAHKEGRKFTVIVVDSSPLFQGRLLVKRLSNYGIRCKYILITSIGTLMPSVTKVFFGASYMLGNGGAVSNIGTSMVGYIARQHKVPVVVFCETYKFTQRVNLDQIRGNEVTNPNYVANNYLLEKSQASQELTSQKNLSILLMKYDLTSVDCISMIICELGQIPAVSVPVVVAEFEKEEEE